MNSRRIPDGNGELLRRIAEGDSGAFAELYDRHRPAVFRTIYTIVRDTGEAEDVLQEVFLQAWAQLARYDPLRASVTGWLLMIARARAVDRLRSQRRRSVSMDAAGRQPPVHVPVPENDCDEADRRGALRHMLNQLSRDIRQPLELVLVRGMTHADVASELGLPLGTVKTRIRAALTHLRDRLSDPGRLSIAAAAYDSVPHAGALAAPLRPAAASPQGDAAAPLLGGSDVLIADDDADTRLIVSAILSRAGAVVRTSASAAEATALARERWPDVVVSDIAMPGGDGYRLIRDLRALASATGRELSAAAFTASMSEHEVRRVLAAGYDRHLMKPAAPAALLEAVHALWGQLR